MPISDDTFAWRGKLPHFDKEQKTFFVTFCTQQRAVLTESERDAVFETCVRGHLRDYWAHALVVMPDHVHILVIPYPEIGLVRMIQTIKSVSAHRIGKRIWQREYFDRALRSDEDARKKGEYICQNPVRAELVGSVDEYRWIWRSWVEGTLARARAPAPPP